MSALQHLHILLAEHFSQDELRTLCYDIGLNPDNVPKISSGISVHAAELVRYTARLQKTDELINACKKARPNANWDSVNHITPFSSEAGSVYGMNTSELASRAIRLQLEGALTEALAVYQQIRNIDPLYPQINSLIWEVETELQGSGVNRFGRADVHAIRKDSVLKASPHNNLRRALILATIMTVVLSIVLFLLSRNYLNPLPRVNVTPTPQVRIAVTFSLQKTPEPSQQSTPEPID